MTNRLAAETSPYLLQHAGNPVDWYPWGEAAFERAREEDRPILLSIGYSACHWCHVMAHESFEDPQTAALMNQLFVNIKVDREERPDVDSVYMQAVIAMTGQGGWPMTVFLTPQGEPFFGGTYFPPEDRQGMRGFPWVLRAIADAYRDRRGEVAASAAQLRDALAPAPTPRRGEAVLGHLETAVARLLDQADARHGGFGGAPKFPHPAALDLLLRWHTRTGDPRSLESALHTLDRMARGGIHDQLGGGFHRYAVDATWSVPHFEKMLYDNAQLATVYLHAWQVTGDERWRRVAVRTLDWMVGEMQLPEGGFASSQDADSPGGEGAYFVWTPVQLDEALGEADGRLAQRLFGVSAPGNFERRASVPSQPEPSEELATALEMAPERLTAERDRLGRALLAVRSRREAPGRDEKVLTSWNGLALGALAEAGAALDRGDYIDAARRCAAFIAANLDGEAGLRRTWKSGRSHIPAFLEDHAFLASGLLSLYEASGDAAFLAWARRLVVDALVRFSDDGVLYDTASDGEPLVVRPRTLDDNPIPAGQSKLADTLLRLSAFDAELSHREQAMAIIEPLAEAIARAPLALSALACALDRVLGPSREIAVSGDPTDPRTRELLGVAQRRWRPRAVLAWGDPTQVPLLEGRQSADGGPAAHVCEGFVCRRPVSDAPALAALLDG